MVMVMVRAGLFLVAAYVLLHVNTAVRQTKSLLKLTNLHFRLCFYLE